MSGNGPGTIGLRFRRAIPLCPHKGHSTKPGCVRIAAMIAHGSLTWRLGIAVRRIINEVRGINRVVYDIISKQPAGPSGSEQA